MWLFDLFNKKKDTKKENKINEPKVTNLTLKQINDYNNGKFTPLGGLTDNKKTAPIEKLELAKIKLVEPIYYYYYLNKGKTVKDKMNLMGHKTATFIEWEKWKKGIKKKSELLNSDRAVDLIDLDKFFIEYKGNYNEDFKFYIDKGTYKFERWDKYEKLINEFIKYLTQKMNGNYYESCITLLENFKKNNTNYMNNGNIISKNKQHLIDYYTNNTESITNIGKLYSYKYKFYDNNILKYKHEFEEYLNNVIEEFFVNKKIKNRIIKFTLRDQPEYIFSIPVLYEYTGLRIDLWEKETKNDKYFRNLVDNKKVLIIEGIGSYFGIEFEGIIKKVGTLPKEYLQITQNNEECRDWGEEKVILYKEVRRGYM